MTAKEKKAFELIDSHELDCMCELCLEFVNSDNAEEWKTKIASQNAAEYIPAAPEPICHYHNGPFQKECPLGGKCERIEDWGKTVVEPVAPVEAKDWEHPHNFEPVMFQGREQLGCSICGFMEQAKIHTVAEPKPTPSEPIDMQKQMAHDDGLITTLQEDTKRLRKERAEWQRKYFEISRALSGTIDKNGDLIKRIQWLEHEKDEIRNSKSQPDSSSIPDRPLKSGFICGAWRVREQGPILNFTQPFQRAKYVNRCDSPDGHDGDHVDSVIGVNWSGPNPEQAAKTLDSSSISTEQTFIPLAEIAYIYFMRHFMGQTVDRDNLSGSVHVHVLAKEFDAVWNAAKGQSNGR